MTRFFPAIGLSAALFACSASAAVIQDVAYGPDPAQHMDIYRPDDSSGAPIILMVHGGGWRFGDKDSRGVVSHKTERWVTRGFVFISINYRMIPAADPLVQASDVARALAFAQTHASDWGGDAKKIILMGHSAGAHLVDLLTADPSLATREGAQRWLGTVSLDSGAIDVPSIMQRRHLPLYDQAFGSDPDFWRAASPLHVLTPQALPLLAVCSSVRRDHPCVQTHAYADRAASLKTRTEVLEQPLNHMQINDTLGLDNDYTHAVEAFMASLDSTVAALLSGKRD